MQEIMQFFSVHFKLLYMVQGEKSLFYTLTFIYNNTYKETPSSARPAGSNHGALYKVTYKQKL